MIVLRRFLTGLLAVALTQFGVMASAPAHAHVTGGGHGVREIVLSHGHADVELPGNEHRHDADGHHDDDSHDQKADIASGGSDPESNGSGHGEHAHVHAFQQFAAGEEAEAPFVPTAYREVVRPAELAAAVRHSSFPPLRPPRSVL